MMPTRPVPSHWMPPPSRRKIRGSSCGTSGDRILFAPVFIRVRKDTADTVDTVAPPATPDLDLDLDLDTEELYALPFLIG